MPVPTPLRSAPARLAARAAVAAARLAAGLGAAGPDEDREAGMSTAEYAVGTVAACGFAGVLYKVVTSPTVLDLLKGVVSRALKVSF